MGAISILTRGGRPRVRRWSDRALEQFRKRVLDLLSAVRYSPEELDFAMDYSVQGRMTRQILRGRQPSRPYVNKFTRLEDEPPPPKPQWLPRAPRLLTGEAIPAVMVEGERKACLECVARRAEGQDVDEFFFPRHPSQVVHRQCRRAWRRRRDWFRRCAELGCDVKGRTCEEEACQLRRTLWGKS